MPTSGSAPPGRRRLASCLIEEAKKARRVDALDCLRDARRELWIVGQNLFGLSGASRNNGPCKDTFKRSFFRKLARYKSRGQQFAIRIAIADPRSTVDIVRWHKEHTPDAQEGQPSVIGDLRLAFNEFLSWQNAATGKGLELHIRCVSFQRETHNIVDPDDLERGFVAYTRTVGDNILNPPDRRWFYPAWGTHEYERRVAELREVLNAGTPIASVGTIDWGALVQGARRQEP